MPCRRACRPPWKVASRDSRQPAIEGDGASLQFCATSNGLLRPESPAYAARALGSFTPKSTGDPIFFATSEKWKGDSATFVAGAAISITTVYTAAYFVFKGTKQSGGSHSSSTGHAIDVVILVLLLFAAVYTFRRRKTAKPPKWMAKLQTASMRLSFNLGLLLLGVFPTDIATSVSVGGHLANKRAPWVDGLPFILLTLLLLALPGLMVLLLGKRAEAFLRRLEQRATTPKTSTTNCSREHRPRQRVRSVALTIAPAARTRSGSQAGWVSPHS